MTRREEVAAGLQLLEQIFSKAGISIRESRRPWHDRTATYIVVGAGDSSTDIVLTDDFLSDLPATREHKSAAESYAQAVAGRIKHGSAQAFYCRSGIPITLETHWPIHTSATTDRGLVSWLMVTATNGLDETEAMCSLQFHAFEYPRPSPFQQMKQIVNRVRGAIDEGSVTFVPPGTHPSNGQIIEQKRIEEKPPASDEEIQRFLLEKTYYLGFRASRNPHSVWISDPWDANYIGATTRALSQAAHIVQARKLITLDSTSQYASPSDKLLSDGPADQPKRPEARAKLSLSTISDKNRFSSDLSAMLERQEEFALILIDLDHFKTVNDTKGHAAGDACLERVIQAIYKSVGTKGDMYRWGGDEFVVCLPDFSADEATATAERIRQSIEDARPGDAVPVTASIGVCAADQLGPQSLEEMFKVADHAMYTSKQSGKNRVTVCRRDGHSE
jgi:diguanylate cyclase (GGDEF)-like protein